MKNRLTGLAAAVAAVLMAPAAMADTLEDVVAAGHLRCGVSEGVPGFSFQDAANNWTGLEVDFCRAMAAAIFDDPDAVRYVPLKAQTRFESLVGGAIDVLSRTTSLTMSRDTELGLSFVGTMFYDGQGFLVREDDDVTSALQLSGARVCIESETTTQMNTADYFAANGLDLSNAVIFPNKDEVVQAYLDGDCDVYTTDASAIAAERSRFPDPDAHIILPEIISKEPLGPVVRADDSRWFNIARWTYFALLNAEELGVTSNNVDDMLGSENPDIRRLLGVERDFGTPIGLTVNWAYRIVKHVGNYGEIYERHIGENTAINIPRGINNLWTEGGIQYAPPIR